ncbi:hypothetical protein HELRODRAFT_83142 [Helobdella robusta]|uniref:Laminin N-terminal domain-containing protein n=1 Tax=Helobdella robusta TaxID=6412 RepID=T1G510_HELRO|nr:hypothetical protein HELRODRAFT_83142 [Helobdella robusta]ESO00347.1 hypothetical protein HELRODRAFT_83142 [Helobdella robusta]
MLIVTVFIISLLRTIESQQDNTGSEQYIPQSDTQNWAAGKKVVATATCGENVSEPELFCKLTGANPDLEGDLSDHQVIQGQYCDYCNPRNPSQTHSAEFVTDGTERWWQSPPLSRGLQYNEVNLTIDLAQELHVGYVYITMGNSPRPRVFALERSKDNGKTWTPWQFFADSESECQHHFGDYEYSENLDADDSVLCTTKFSDVKPLEGGEIYVSLINNRPSAERFQESKVLKEWTKATNIRLRLLRVNTLLGRLMAINQQDVTVTRRYFYSIKGISVGGSCICNGHARECTKPDPKNHLKKLCECQHNTCGDHCDQCCYPFIQKKWRPAETHSNNECERCQCNGHSDTCYYSEEVAQNKSSLDIYGNYEGGGVCTNCQHNTEGCINCQKCRRGYYKRANVLMNARNACAKCNCDTIFSSGACDDETGRCQCKPEFSGPDCRRCNEGYFGYPRCQPCRCHVNGTRDKVCDPSGGVCPCKENYDGPNCDQCAQGFYNFPECKR